MDELCLTQGAVSHKHLIYAYYNVCATALRRAVESLYDTPPLPVHLPMLLVKSIIFCLFNTSNCYHDILLLLVSNFSAVRVFFCRVIPRPTYLVGHLANVKFTYDAKKFFIFNFDLFIYLFVYLKLYVMTIGK